MGRWRWVVLVVALLAGAGAIVFVVASGAMDSGVTTTVAAGDLPAWSTTTTVPDPVSTTSTVPDHVSEVFATGASIPDETVDVVLYVDPTGDDASEGLEESEPLRTVGHALDLASELRLGGNAVKVELAPGVYRESIELLQDPDGSPVLVLEAAEPGTAVITGADTWTDWAWNDERGAFVHDWPFDWAPGADFGEVVGRDDLEEIVGRREMVVIEGVRLDQVLRISDLADGTFMVDDDAGELLLLPPEGSAFPGQEAEVAVRERLMNLDSVRNMVVRGLTFRHAAAPFESSAVRISNSRHVLFESNTVVENSWTGLGLSTSSSLTVRENVLNENGGGGAGIFKTVDVVLDGNDTSLNNWRGFAGDYTGWSIAGVKAVGVTDLVIRGHRAWGNLARGLWLDFDVSRVSIEDSSACHNVSDGLYLEAVLGPVVVQGTESCENGRYGLLIVNIYETTLIDSVICGNAEAQIQMNANQGGRQIETEDGVIDMIAARDLTMTSNIVAGMNPLFDVGISDADFSELIATLTAGSNTWRSFGGNGEAFEFPGGDGDLEEWQEATGSDLDSTYGTGAAGDCDSLAS